MTERTYIIKDNDEIKLPITKAEYVQTADGGLDDTIDKINKSISGCAPKDHSHSDYATTIDLNQVKQSGVESNKILVDALNSKNVSASTKDSIKTNVNKVKDIIVKSDIKIAEFTGGKDATLQVDFKPLQVVVKADIIDGRNTGSMNASQHSGLIAMAGLLDLSSGTSTTTTDAGHSVNTKTNLTISKVEFGDSSVKVSVASDGTFNGQPKYYVLGM